jgi:hypothetical protein
VNDPSDQTERDLAEGLVIRAAERRASGTRTAWKRLPLCKDDYPKLLCLDQNKWIGLAQAHYGRAEGAPFVDALAAIRQGVSRGKVVVPVAAANLYEAAEPANESRRERLARFMVDLSENHSLVNHQIVRRWELRRAVVCQFLRGTATSRLRARSFRPLSPWRTRRGQRRP